MVLIAVTVVGSVLLLAVYHYSDFTFAEYKASFNFHKQAQSKALANSGVHWVMGMLATREIITNQLSDNPWDNPEQFSHVQIGNGYFTVFAPPDPDDELFSGRYRHGASDEAGKIDVNGLMALDKTGKRLKDMLLKLPDMTEEIADAILDWLDTDNDPRPLGAENDAYAGQSPSYRCKNGPIETIEELLLVRGVTLDLLFGLDKNRNGIIDPEEDDGTGISNRGWSAYLTVYSRLQNVDDQGQPLADLNGGELATLYDQLTEKLNEDLAKYVVLCRLYGASAAATTTGVLFSPDGTVLAIAVNTGGNSRPGSLSSLSRDQLTAGKAQKKINSIFDLVNTQVTVQGGRGQPSLVYSSPLNDPAQQRELLAKMFQTSTATSGTESRGKINVNTAPREVLAAFPEFTDTDVETILSLRPSMTGDDTSDDTFDTPAWLLTEAKLKVNTLKNLEKYITTRTQVYRVQVQGYFEGGKGPVSRVEAVIDTNAGRPRIVFSRDISDAGRIELDQ